jgi:DNA-binding NtrC family response regulator
VRIIAASNRDLAHLVASGEFREDLYYRLADLVISIPPLRETLEEIAPLTQRFVQATCAELRRTVPELAPGLTDHLGGYPWRGNIRELQSVIRRTLLTAGPMVAMSDIRDSINRTEATAAGGENAVLTLRQAEEAAVRAALSAANGRQAAAARFLDIDYSRFKRLVEKYGIVA